MKSELYKCRIIDGRHKGSEWTDSYIESLIEIPSLRESGEWHIYQYKLDKEVEDTYLYNFQGVQTPPKSIQKTANRGR